MTEKSSSRSLEEEDLTAKMSLINVSSPDEDIIQKGPLFDPENYNSLIQIVNQLDPRSFVKFSRTCKDLHNFCFNANGIQVQFPCFAFAEVNETDEIQISLNNCRENGRVGSVISEQELRKMSFIIVIKEIHMDPGDSRLLEEMRQLLTRFSRVIVELVTGEWATEEWNDLIQFLQDYNVNRLHLEIPFETRPVIPEDLLPFFLTKLEDFEYHEDVTDDLILSTAAKSLYLSATTISKNTFMELLRKFANEDFVDWEIGREPHYEGEDSDPFIKACSEMMKVVKLEEIDRKNMEPFVLYNRPRDPEIFYLLKFDGSVGNVRIHEDEVFFGNGI